MKNSKHIFFDLDHTLWDFDKNSALAFERIFTTFKIEMEYTRFRKIYEPINFEYWKRFREDRVNKEELRRGRLIDSFKKFEIEFPMETIDSLAEAYIDELPGNNHLFPGTIEILEYLSAKYELHIITNGFKNVQHIKLDKSNIGHYFKTVTTSEEVGVKKPNPLVFQYALKQANAKAMDSVMIGDTFEADILGAEAVGMHTIFYNYRNENLPQKYIKVDSLLEIQHYL